MTLFCRFELAKKHFRHYLYGIMYDEMSNFSICHVITRMIVGGAQENTLLSCLGQLQAGHAVTLVTGPSPGPEGELLARMKAPNLEIVVMPELVRELAPVMDVKAFFRLRRFFRERRFEVVHTHSSKAGIVGRFAAYAAGVPCVVHTIHGQAFHLYEKAWKNAFYKSAERLAARRSDRIFAVAQAMVDQCVAGRIAPAAKYQVVYSGMDISSFLAAQREPELRRTLGIPEDAPVIGTLARLFELKGYDYVLQAAPLVLAKHPETHFLIVGDGLLRRQLEQEADRLGIRDQFHFAGLVAPSEVPRYIVQMDMLWHLSLREGLPRSVVQALAGGIPAIGFRLDGTPEVVFDGETGYCAAPGDYRAVAEHANMLLDDPARARRLGARGRELVKERFDAPRMSAILLKAYAEILKAKRS